MIIDNQVSDTHLGDRGRVMGTGDPDSTIFLHFFFHDLAKGV